MPYLKTDSPIDKHCQNKNGRFSPPVFLYVSICPEVLFMRTPHAIFSRTQLSETAAFQAYALVQLVTPAADIKSAAVFIFICSVFFGEGGYHFPYALINAVMVYLFEKAFFTEGSHSAITDTTAHGGTTAESFPSFTVTSKAAGFTVSGASNSFKL